MKDPHNHDMVSLAWDVGTVLRYLNSQPKKNKSLHLKELSMKLAMLLALTSACRTSEIHKFDINFMTTTENEIFFYFSQAK